MEPPPGGPPDPDPPRLLATVPDSMASVPGFKGEVEFQFDEVISEGSASTGTGTGELERLVILSPTDKVAKVRWRRSRITVEPDGGWRPDRVYRVELLPGVTDLRRNRSDEGRVVTFTTGAPAPGARLEGRVVDWTTNRPAPEALVVATLLPDSLPYRALADSAGRFSFGPLPAGEYIVRGVLDQNRNRRADGREAFDTIRVRAASGPAKVGELWAFVHDTTPPRIASIRMSDSLSAAIELNQALAPGHSFKPADATVRVLPDSAPWPVASVLPRPLDDSLHRKAEPPADSARADSARADTLPPSAEVPAPGGRPGREPSVLTTRPQLNDQLVLRVRRPWTPGGRYVVTVRNLRNVTGVTGEATITLAVPERQPEDTTRTDSTRADTTRAPKPARADSARAKYPRPDSLRARPARPDSATRRRP